MGDRLECSARRATLKRRCIVSVEQHGRALRVKGDPKAVFLANEERHKVGGITREAERLRYGFAVVREAVQIGKERMNQNPLPA